MYEDILNKVTKKGWNLYDAGARMDQNLFHIIPRGHVSVLEMHTHYLVLPSIAHPKDIGEIQKALEEMDLRKEFPIIHYKQITLPLPVFLIKNEGIRVYSSRQLLFPYVDFVHCLDTLVDRTSN